MARTLHPRHGTHAPASGTPPRRPGSVRRTTTLDMLRPEGVFGPVTVIGRGRDLATPRSGDARVEAAQLVQCEVAFMDNRTLKAIAAEPDEPRLADLVGQRVSSGFRARLDTALARHRDEESLLYQLFDDLPVATLISGYVFSTVPLPPSPPADTHPNQDLCAGWRSGGTIMVEIARSGRPPMVTGPVAPPLLPDDDPLAWHDLAPLPPHGMRRHRRTDLWRRDDGLVDVDSFFRDSHMGVDGVETVIHEYTVTAVLDADTASFVHAQAQPGALPWVECPPAAASATGLGGVAVRDVRAQVRATFTGTGTCTHLNDQLRSLAGVAALVGAIPTD